MPHESLCLRRPVVAALLQRSASTWKAPPGRPRPQQAPRGRPRPQAAASNAGHVPYRHHWVVGPKGTAINTAVEIPQEARELVEWQTPERKELREQMGMELIFLGTGSGHIPSLDRGNSSLCMRLGGEDWLFDAGEGVQRRFVQAGLRLRPVRRVFVTHMHADHVLGLPGFLMTVSGGIVSEENDAGVRRTPTAAHIDVYGPVGLYAFLSVAFGSTAARLHGLSVTVHELVDPEAKDECRATRYGLELVKGLPTRGQQVRRRTIEPDADGFWTLVHDNEKSDAPAAIRMYGERRREQRTEVRVRAAKLKHTISCFGFVVQEAPRVGSLNAAKLTAMGLRPSPLYKQLKRDLAAGNVLTLENGTVIRPEEVLEPPLPGRKVVILGDTSDPSAIAPLARDADVLVHEATRALEPGLPDNSAKYGHSTSAAAGRFARGVNAHWLILTHIGSRYQGAPSRISQPPGSLGFLMAQAVEQFGSRNCMVASDFMALCVPSGGFAGRRKVPAAGPAAAEAAAAAQAPALVPESSAQAAAAANAEEGLEVAAH